MSFWCWGELEKNQQLQTLITKENDLIGETILKSIAADTGDFDLNDYMEYKKDPDAFLKILKQHREQPLVVAAA